MFSRQLNTDISSPIKSTVFQKAMAVYNIELKYGAPYRASTQGLIEKSHLLFRTTLSAFLLDSQKDWSKFLPFITATMNSRHLLGSDITPYCLYFSRFAPTALGMLFRKIPRYADDNNASFLRLQQFATHSLLVASMSLSHLK